MADGLDPTEMVKVGGGGAGVGAGLMWLLSRLLDRSDRDTGALTAKLDLVIKAQQELGQQIAVMTDRLTRTNSDLEGMRLHLADYQKASTLLDARVIRLEERLDQIADRVERFEVAGRARGVNP
jgi:hypothetical protein